MSDAQAAPAAEQAVVFNLQRVYLRDCSLEIPQAPQIFLDTSEPRLEFEIDTTEQELGGDMVEVGVRCTITCRVGDGVGFLVEATQAAIFEIQGVSPEQRTLLKGISCPNIVYPYLRSNIADLIQRSSFPPVHLSEINWEGFFQQKLSKLAAENTPAGASESGLILPQ
jgi:preprotein translocase subunit SecB